MADDSHSSFEQADDDLRAAYEAGWRDALVVGLGEPLAAEEDITNENLSDCFRRFMARRSSEHSS